jgi:hypothetical protein
MSDGSGAPDPERFVAILEAIREIFLKHEYIHHATLVADLIDLAHLDSPDLPRKLGEGGLWGSAGSVADVVGLRPSLDPVDAETERDSVELIRGLIRLADEMRAQGIASEVSEFVANAFRRGLEKRRSRERGG